MSLSSKGSCGSNSSSLSSTAGELGVLENEEDFRERLHQARTYNNFKKTGKRFPSHRDTHPGVDEFPRYINNPSNRKVINKCLKENENNFQALRKEFARQDFMREQTRRNDDIHFAIKNSAYGDKVSCVYSDYNSDKLIFRIRVSNYMLSKKKSLDQSDDIYMLKDFQDALLNNIVLRGLSKISNITPRKLQNIVNQEDGKYSKHDTWVLDMNPTLNLGIFQ